MNKKNNKPLAVCFFQEAVSGNVPALDWLRKLSKDEREIIGADLLFIQVNWPIGRPLVGTLGDGLWELRSSLNNREARMIFMFRDDVIVVLHGFIKKTQKIPDRELSIARKREKSYDFQGGRFQ